MRMPAAGFYGRVSDRRKSKGLRASAAQKKRNCDMPAVAGNCTDALLETTPAMFDVSLANGDFRPSLFR